MRLFSSPSEVAAATGEKAWLRGLLDFEAGLAAALAEVGLAPAAAAAEIAAACAESGWDLDALGAGTARDGTPVPALLEQLGARLSGDARAVLHCGATSQDAVDTAAMLVSRRVLVPLLGDLEGAGDAAAVLADRHRSDLAVGRTLLQQALPITFGLRAAVWLGGLDDAAARLTMVRDERLALQLGGAVGTLAAFGDRGLEVAAALSRRLDLPAPAVPWQANRARVVELAAALGEAAGAAGKVGTDVVLLAQTEVGEVTAGDGGRSSTMPQKRNPTAAVTAVAAARRTPALVATLFAAMPGEEERAAGSWQAEAEPLAELLRLTGEGAGAARRALESLEVDPERMRANLDLTEGLVMAEGLASSLGEIVGRVAAAELVGAATRRAAADGQALAEAAAAIPEIVEALGADGIAASLDPAGYLGSIDQLIDRALARHRERRGR